MQTITLVGTDGVERAASTISSAADTIYRAASTIESTAYMFTQRLDEFINRLEALKESQNATPTP
jgi:hypothetical protein